jgi:hypothetical protein
MPIPVVMQITAALLLTSSLVALGGCHGVSCGDGTPTDTPVGAYRDIGYPTGATACASPSFPDEPRVAYDTKDEHEAVSLFSKYMTSKGYKSLHVSSKVNDEQLELATRGVRVGTLVLFGKDGATERYEAEIKAEPVGDTTVDLRRLDCTPGTPHGTNDEFCE